MEAPFYSLYHEEDGVEFVPAEYFYLLHGVDQTGVALACGDSGKKMICKEWLSDIGLPIANCKR